MVDFCGVIRISLNVALVGAIIFAYANILSSLVDAQKNWNPKWSDLIEKPEFISYGVEGFKLADIRALNFFYMEKYKNIPDLQYNKICRKVRNKLIVFPLMFFLLAICLFGLPC